MRKILLEHIDKKLPGLEIGPSHSPYAAKSDGYNVKILDHLNQEKLKNKYKNQDYEKIEHVDYVWNGEPYVELIGKKECFNWIVASHVIEHTVDLIQFLKDCSDLLVEGGKLCLAIPDCRFCFDHFRFRSSLSSIIDSHMNKAARHSIGTVADYYLNVVSNDQRLAWSKAKKNNDYNLCYDQKVAKNKILEYQSNDLYTDVHAWKFTPVHFKMIIHDLYLLGFMKFGILKCTRTFGHEFFAVLEKNLEWEDFDRVEFLKQVKLEK